MKRDDIVNLMLGKRNGSWFTLQYTAEVPVNAVAKKSGTVVTKSSRMTCRKGIKYSNIKSVKEADDKIKEAGGKPEHELPWGTWNKEYPNILIDHKDQEYVRVYPGPNKVKTNYYLNNQKISYEDLKKLNVIQPSWISQHERKKEKPKVITIKTSNIEAISHKGKLVLKSR